MGEFQIWSRSASEFPRASVRPRELRARGIALAGDLQRWLALAWDWFKPRTVPVIVAGIGMVFVLAATDYLAHAHGDDQPRNDVLVVHTR